MHAHNLRWCPFQYCMGSIPLNDQQIHPSMFLLMFGDNQQNLLKVNSQVEPGIKVMTILSFCERMANVSET